VVELSKLWGFSEKTVRRLFANEPGVIKFRCHHSCRSSRNPRYPRAHPGEVFGYLAHAHPFLEGNGRTILTIFADLTRRACFHVEWEASDKDQFLETLTRERLGPGKLIMDQFVLPYLWEGVLSIDKTARRLRVNFTREEGPPPDSAEL
jgi:cell filamentation protein